MGEAGFLMMFNLKYMLALLLYTEIFSSYLRHRSSGQEENNE
jgi:hypothetical protein